MHLTAWRRYKGGRLALPWASRGLHQGLPLSFTYGTPSLLNMALLVEKRPLRTLFLLWSCDAHLNVVEPELCQEVEAQLQHGIALVGKRSLR